MAKQVIVVRADLKMSKGKIASQAAHASLSAVLKMMDKEDSQWGEKSYRLQLHVTENTPLYSWLEEGFTKVCLRVESDEELLALLERAREAKIPCSLIIDKGLTVFDGIPTHTCIAIGPADNAVIDAITGHLKLLS